MTAGSPFGDIAPALAGDSDDVLFGDVWQRPGLSPRERSLITVAALIFAGWPPASMAVRNARGAADEAGA